MIGSVGKSLTTLMIARLVERGRLGWDTPVVDVLPSFGLGDEATTKATTMRHTACACTGMPRQDLEFLFEGAMTPEARLATMKAMKPTTAFGETFQYSNLMVSAGGFAAAHAYAPRLGLGPAYDRAMQELVFAPFGMKATTFDFKVVARGDHAVPHPRDLHGEPAPLPIDAERWVLPIRPAGGTWSTVRDMARVLLVELGRGKLGGKQVIAEQALLARRAPQVKIDDEGGYGLGLVVGTRYGIPFVSHTGGTGGFSTRFSFWPEHDVGLVIVSNASGAGLLNGTVERRLLELLFDGRAEARENVALAVERQAQARAEELARIELAPDAAWFGTLAGAWTAPGLGRIDLAFERGKAVLDAGEWKVPVGRKTARDGTVMLVSTGGLLPGLELVPRDQDGRSVLVLDAGQHKIVFERVQSP
jgi:CubicO group peptidase (beta-lactamase class C family)